jgi:hypothetical protein
MTPPERLNAPPAAIHHPRRRAPARNAEVRLNSDGDHDDARPKRQNRPELSHGTGVRGPRVVAPRPYSTPLAICRRLKSHR